LACQEAKDKGFDEALVLDEKGNVAESSGANVFYEKDGKLEVIYENGVLSVNGTALDSAATAPYRSMLPAEKSAKLVLRSK
jgi:branched-subunit amino acid aminotransferase/4-amino-4-deoxychorismate lyase